jgi:hypothetical protein
MKIYKPEILIIGSDNDVNLPQIFDWLNFIKQISFF